MGYFDGLTDACFKTNMQGTTLFYKWGVLGKGYILPSIEKKDEIRKFVKLYYMVSLPTIIGAGAFINWLWAMLLVIPFFIWFQIKISSLTKGLAISNEKLTLKESYTNSAKGHNKTTLWLLLIFSILMFLGGLFMLLIARDFKGQILGISFIIMFGTCSAVFIYMLKMKKA
ncbi:MAG: hypothetical protein ABFD50_02030 [Smithella sp.]